MSWLLRETGCFCSPTLPLMSWRNNDLNENPGCVVSSYITDSGNGADNCFCFFYKSQRLEKSCVPVGGVSPLEIRVGRRASSGTKEGPPQLSRDGGGLGGCLPCEAFQALSLPGSPRVALGL